MCIDRAYTLTWTGKGMVQLVPDERKSNSLARHLLIQILSDGVQEIHGIQIHSLLDIGEPTEFKLKKS